MRFKKLDLNLLTALDHMIELRSVSAAADKMFMSQSAMSNALRRLRIYFDDPLLVQVGRRMVVTPRAEAMRPAIRDILVRIEATIDSQPEFQPDESTRAFNILLSDYTIRVLMPAVFRLLDQQNATVSINMRPPTNTPQILLERGEIDLLVTPEIFLSKGHPAELLFEDDYVVAAWAKGKYGNCTMDKATYESAAHATIKMPNGTLSGESYLLKKAGINRNIEVETFSFSTLPHLISQTDRITTLQSRLVDAVAPQADLVTYPLPIPIPPARQMVQWHEYRAHDPGIVWLRTMMQQAARDLNLDSSTV